MPVFLLHQHTFQGDDGYALADQVAVYFLQNIVLEVRLTLWRLIAFSCSKLGGFQLVVGCLYYTIL